MANIIDYVRWRGDIPVWQAPLGEVDALVLSYLSYMPFDEIVSDRFDGEGTRLGDACEKMLARGVKSACMMDSEKEDCALLEAVKESERFAGMRLIGFINRYDKEQEEQFSAITFVVDRNLSVIAFRGTDSTVVGWKEDFNMSFSGEVPSQRNAYYYVQKAADVLSGRLMLCGHSKGGNLAAYAGVFAGEAVQKRISCIYNFDGPGFNESIIVSPEFGRIDMRIHTYVPQSSLIGILLWHAEPFTVVKSDAISVFQHNPYTWQVMGGKLVRVPSRTEGSRFAEQTIKRWLDELPVDERRKMIDGIYNVLSASDGRNVADLFDARSIMSIVRAAGDMDEVSRGAIIDAFKLLGSSLMETVPEWLDKAATGIRERIGREKLPPREEKSEENRLS